MKHHHPKRENLLYHNQSYHEIFEDTKSFDRCKSKKGVSVSIALAIFNCSSGV